MDGFIAVAGHTAIVGASKVWACISTPCHEPRSQSPLPGFILHVQKSLAVETWNEATIIAIEQVHIVDLEIFVAEYMFVGTLWRRKLKTFQH